MIVRPNDIFFAINGTNSNGNNYIKKAIINGAKVIVSNLNFKGFDKNKILYLKSNNPKIIIRKLQVIFNKKAKKYYCCNRYKWQNII